MSEKQIEPNAAERLFAALLNAAGSREYRDASATGDHEATWRALADATFRELPPAFVDVIPHGRIPGFLEANSELTETLGKRLVLVTDSETNRVVRAYLEPAVIVDDVIYAADEHGRPITNAPSTLVAGDSA